MRKIYVTSGSGVFEGWIVVSEVEPWLVGDGSVGDFIAAVRRDYGGTSISRMPFISANFNIPEWPYYTVLEIKESDQ